MLSSLIMISLAVCGNFTSHSASHIPPLLVSNSYVHRSKEFNLWMWAMLSMASTSSLFWSSTAHKSVNSSIATVTGVWLLTNHSLMITHPLFVVKRFHLRLLLFYSFRFLWPYTFFLDRTLRSQSPELMGGQSHFLPEGIMMRLLCIGRMEHMPFCHMYNVFLGLGYRL